MIVSRYKSLYQSQEEVKVRSVTIQVTNIYKIDFYHLIIRKIRIQCSIVPRDEYWQTYQQPRQTPNVTHFTPHIHRHLHNHQSQPSQPPQPNLNLIYKINNKLVSFKIHLKNHSPFVRKVSFVPKSSNSFVSSVANNPHHHHLSQDIVAVQITTGGATKSTSQPVQTKVSALHTSLAIYPTKYPH